MYVRLALIVFAGFLVANFAFAQSGASQDKAAKMDRHFAFTDKNSDGFIARDEAASYPALMKHFGVIDSDSDGKLSREEMQAYRMGTHTKPRVAKSARKATTENDRSSSLTKADADDEGTTPRKNF